MNHKILNTLILVSVFAIAGCEKHVVVEEDAHRSWWGEHHQGEAYDHDKAATEHRDWCAHNHDKSCEGWN